MAGEVHLDALPYIDQGYEVPGVREAAMQMVEEETRRYRPTKNYLEFLPLPKTSFETEILKAEFERLTARQPMEVLSMKRYELPQPGAAQRNDLAAWQESVENSMAQLEHQGGRILNLELLTQFSSNEWRLHNTLLSQVVDQKQKQLKALRSQIQEVNWQRKSEQTTAGAQLTALEAHWNALVHKNFEIERACLELEGEIHRLRQEAAARNIQLSGLRSFGELSKIAVQSGVVRAGFTEDIRRRKDEYQEEGYSGTMFYTRTENMKKAENRLLEMRSYRHNIQTRSNSQPEPGYVYVIKGRLYQH